MFRPTYPYFYLGLRLSGVTAVVTDEEMSPDVEYSNLDSYNLCATWHGDPLSIVKLECEPGATGRYLYLYLPHGGNPWLTLCEVEVFGGEPHTPPPGKEGKRAGQDLI